MNCRPIEPLLLAERDGVLTNEQHAALASHVATCPACRQRQAVLTETMEAFRADAAAINVPNADGEWRTLRAQLPSGEAKPSRQSPLATAIWFGVPLAAAMAIAFLIGSPTSPQTQVPARGTESARADFIEAADPTASTLVYVDKDSGWLVVWATSTDSQPAG